ncbi:trypsin-like serine protease, partial [Bradyrhizobium sp.]|uniref:trypsin-like serine protease n=1 Tax=Bradyrhizobium sp. TaxID=376 RepID=UPI0025C39072
MIKQALAGLIVFFGLADPLAAAELDDAVAAAHRRDYAAALRRLSPLADKGDARAQFDIGFMHAYGWGVPRDAAAAIPWYRKAADQGLAVAQHALGLALVNGDGVRPDDAEAARWFARAAAQGFAQAQFMRGLMALDGRGVEKDPVQGYAFIVMAAQGGVRSAPRVAQAVPLTASQRAQAQDIIAQGKPKPESSLASVSDPRPEELLGLDRHIGEVVDATIWPASAIGVVTMARFDRGGWCTGTLVAPKVVLTAAHCLLNGTDFVTPGNVHFLAGMDKGTPASSAAAERFILAKDFVPTLKERWTVDRSPADWALIVLKDAVPARPVAVKALSREQVQAAAQAGTISEIGYGEERRYSPTALKNCRADRDDRGLMLLQCLANHGYSGSPILADIDGTPAVIGILSAIQEEKRLSIAASASQFEAAVREAIAA